LIERHASRQQEKFERREFFRKMENRIEIEEAGWFQGEEELACSSMRCGVG